MSILTNKNIQWRGYQKELLKKIPEISTNQSIHFVAPPGSGKTYLGLEIIRQLNKKALILVPSLILKEQWLTIIREIFLVDTTAESLLSTQLDSPGELTVDTYQGFYSKVKKSSDYLNQNDIELLVLDEAHHLKKSWGDLLVFLKESSPAVTTISLTATPPFDAEKQEWEQYFLLNGPIDEEIAIPQLVKENVITPHQDYLYLVTAPERVKGQYQSYFDKQAEVVEQIVSSQEIVNFLLKQPFIWQPQEEEKFIFKHYDVYLSALIFLSNHQYQLTNIQWSFLGLSRRQGKKLGLPELDDRHLSCLLSYVYEIVPDLQLFSYLEQQSWISQNRLKLFPDFPEKLLNRAPLEKKEAILKILLCEYEEMGEALSGLILTDFIKKEALFGEANEMEYGVIPIFDSLFPFFNEQLSIAAICGEFLIIPKKIRNAFHTLSIKSEQHPYFATHEIIYLNEKNRSVILGQVTTLVDQKNIRILVGTVSLLGEGWDCPEINTVILANRSASYVQTQQLRGRGLRVNGKNKTTNIWHLAVALPEFEIERQVEIQRISKRLGYICGLTFAENPVIESGADRFYLPLNYSANQIITYNQDMLFWSRQRKKLPQFWQSALEKGSQLTMPIVIRKEKPLYQLDFKKKAVNENSAKGLISGGAVLTGLTIAAFVIDPLIGLFFVGIDGTAIITISNRRKIKKIYAAQREKLSWKKKRKKIAALAVSVCQSYIEQERLTSDALNQIVIDGSDKELVCYLKEGTYQEKKLFHETMLECFAPLQNPRYLIEAKRSGVIVIPETFARNRKIAEQFMKRVNEQLRIKGKLIYTRNIEGRIFLTQEKLIRMNSLQKDSEKIVVQKSIWM